MKTYLKVLSVGLVFFIVSCEKNINPQTKITAGTSDFVPNNVAVALTNTPGEIIGVTIMQDGTILGVGTDDQLYTKASLNDSEWAATPNVTGKVIGVAVMQDGTILGAGTDDQLYTRANLNSQWVATLKVTGKVIGVAVMQDGTILGVGTDDQLYTRTNLNSQWVKV